MKYGPIQTSSRPAHNSGAMGKAPGAVNKLGTPAIRGA